MNYVKNIHKIILLNTFFLSCLYLYSQEHEVVAKDTLGNILQSPLLEKELLDIINKGAESHIISDELKDTILQFINYSKLINQQILKDQISINKDTNIIYPPFEYIPREDNFKESKISNGINSSFMLPDKLPVPERDSRNEKGYFEPGLSVDDLRKRMRNVDYFSKGIDGYYTKLIEMGYVGEGWIETRELRELITRIRAGLAEDVKNGKYTDRNTMPAFLNRMSANKNPLIRQLGGILRMMHNASVNYSNRAPWQLQYKIQSPRN